jgi:hypothetical protein
MLTHKDSKSLMIGALKKIVVPKLKIIGFSGTFPHFRKNTGPVLSFASFQFNRHGGSFVFEFARTKSLEKDLPKFAKSIPLQKLNYGYFNPKNRLRLKPKGTPEDYWFIYNDFTKTEQYDQLASSVLKLLPQAEKFITYE